jgi:hypothetical protein
MLKKNRSSRNSDCQIVTQEVESSDVQEVIKQSAIQLCNINILFEIN